MEGGEALLACSWGQGGGIRPGPARGWMMLCCQCPYVNNIIRECGYIWMHWISVLVCSERDMVCKRKTAGGGGSVFLSCFVLRLFTCLAGKSMVWYDM